MSDLYPRRCPTSISRSYSSPPKRPRSVEGDLEYPKPTRRYSAPARAPAYLEVPKMPAIVKCCSDPSNPPTSTTCSSTHPGTERRLSEPFQQSFRVRSPESYFFAVRMAASWGLPRAESEPQISVRRIDEELSDEWAAIHEWLEG
jgi:hypothetical protein